MFLLECNRFLMSGTPGSAHAAGGLWHLTQPVIHLTPCSASVLGRAGTFCGARLISARMFFESDWWAEDNRE